tara:strand:+ start:67 stop:1518 length:1452 start_codon:yes stop_codon:yes gene_type:complete
VIQDKSKNLINWEIVSINPNDKNWNWKDLFCFWAVSIQSVIGFSLIASLYLVYDLNFFVVLFGGLIASLLALIFSTIIGKPSQKHGLPFPVILRSSSGVIGAKYIAMIRGIVGIFMFGVQTFFISKAIGYLLRIFIFSINSEIMDNEIFLTFFMGMNLLDIISFIFTLYIQYIFFSKGQRLIRSIIKFSSYFVYFGLIIFLILITENFQEVIKAAELSLSFSNFISKSNIYPLMSVTGTLFAFFSIIILNFGDFSRYVKNNDQLIKGNLTLILNFIFFSIFAILIVLGADIILSKNSIEVSGLLTNPNDIIGKLDNTFLSVIVIIFILVASSSTNLIANYVPSQNILINLIPNKLNLKSAGLIIILISFFVGLFWLPVLSQIGILSILDTVGSFFGPIFGVIIADYFVIKGSKIESKHIYSLESDGSYFYSKGWHLKGLYAIFIGFIFASSTIWNINLNFLQSFAWIIGAIISFITYYLLTSK